MRRPLLGALVAVTVVAVWVLAAPLAAGQGQSFVTTSVCPDDTPAKFHPCALTAAKTFTPPRGADGKPDMSGYWRRRAAAFEDLEAHPRTPDDGGGPSVVVDPPDGKVPMQPWADLRRRENAAKYLHHNAACLPAGAVPTMYMANLYQFLQTPDYLAVVGEGLSEHPYRTIPLGGTPVGRKIVMFQGDSRGRWEGNTLVVETTNFNDRSPATNFLGSTDALQLVERFTIVDANTLRYEYTVTDPKTWTRPWSVEAPLPRIDPPLYEFACHEQNYGLINLVMGAQIRATEGILDPRDPRATSQTAPR